MPRNIYNVDRHVSGTTPSWNKLPEGHYALIDYTTLIDESANFDSYPFQVRDNVRYQTHYPGEVEFRLLEFFGKPRTKRAVEAFFEGDLASRLRPETTVDEPLADYMTRALGLGLLKPIQHDGETSDSWATGTCWQPGGQPIHFRAPALQHHDKRVRSFPATVAINLTERCNLSCLHCCVGASPLVDTSQNMTPAELSRVFDMLEEGGVLTVRLTGGEPTVRGDFWQIIEDASSRRFSLVLFTNGSQITEEHALRLKAIRKKKGSRFSVHLSLDGGTPETHDFLRNRKGNFKRVVNTMKLFQKHDVRFFVESVLHAATFSSVEVDRVAQIVREHGASWLSVHPADEIGNGTEEAAIMLRREELVRMKEALQPIVAKWRKRGLEIRFSSFNFPLDEPGNRTGQRQGREKPPGNRGWEQEFDAEITRSRSSGYNVCTAGISQLALGANGDVYACPRYVGDSQHSIGNIREQHLIDIWGSPRWDWLREDWSQRLSICGHCNYKSNCFYGRTCRANPGKLFDDEYGVAPECIREYRALGISYEVVTNYLREVRDMTPLREERTRLCESLLKELAKMEAGTVPDTNRNLNAHP